MAMKRSSIRRRTPLRKANPERIEYLRELQYGDWADEIRAMNCCVCGERPPSVAAHAKTRGSGGTKRDLAPLCEDHERKFHSLGRETFNKVYRIDLLEHAHALWERRN